MNLISKACKTTVCLGVWQTHMMPLQLKALLCGHVVLLQQVAFLREEGVIVWYGCCYDHLVVGILFIYYAVIEQQPAVGLWTAPRKHWFACKKKTSCFVGMKQLSCLLCNHNTIGPLLGHGCAAVCCCVVGHTCNHWFACRRRSNRNLLIGCETHHANCGSPADTCAVF